MASEDRILKILFQIQSDLAGLDKLKSGVKDAAAAGEEAKKSFNWEDAFRFAGAEEALRRVLDVIKEIPTKFEEAIRGGIEFNATLQNVQTGIAGILRQTQPAKFVDFTAAKEEAGNYVDLLKSKANELGRTYEEFFSGFEHAQQSMSLITDDVQKQISLFTALSGAMAAMSISGARAARDTSDLFRGMAQNTAAGSQLAAGLHITVNELDRLIQQANQGGTAFEFWMKTLTGFRESTAAAAQNFDASVNRMKNGITDLESEAAKPFMQPLQEAMQQFTSAFKGIDARAWAKVLGDAFVQLALDIKEGTIELTHFIDQHRILIGFFTAGSSEFYRLAAGSADAAHDAAAEQLKLDLLQKQTQEIRNQIAASDNSTATVLPLQHALNLKIAEVKRDITAETEKGAAADQSVLGALNNLLATLVNIASKFFEIQGTAVATANAIREISPALQKLLDQQNLFHQETYGNEADIYKAKWISTYHSIADEAKKTGQNLSESELQQLTYERLMGPERLKELSATQAVAGAARDVTEFTREQALLLTQIRNAQEVIKANPFLSVDQKTEQSIPLIISEIQTLNAEIQKGQSLINGGTLDAAQYDRVAQEVDNLRTKVQLLGFQLQTLSFGGGFQAGLTQWANSFGTAAQQAANALTGTLNTAIGGTSQALTGLIFGTKNWQQAFLQAAQSIVQSLIKIALQFIVSRLLMAALNRTAGATDASAATSQASTVAAAWAPAGTAAAIATEGTAAATGLAAFLAALGAGVAGATALASVGGAAGSSGFELGGFTGEGPAGGIAGFVHYGEYVMPQPVVRNFGLSNLEAIKQGAARASSGSGSAPGTAQLQPQVINNHALFLDVREARKWLLDREGEGHIVDIMRRHIVQ